MGESLLSLRGPAQQKAALVSAAALVRLTEDASLSRLQSVEELLVRLLQARLLPDCLLQALVDQATASAGVTEAERSGAMLLLAFAASTGSPAISRSVAAIAAVGLPGNPASQQQQPAIARSACLCITRVLQPAVVAQSADGDEKAAHSGLLASVLHRLELLLLDARLSSAAADWYTAAQQAVRWLFLLHPTPEALLTRVVHELTSAALYRRPQAAAAAAVIGSVEALTRLLFVVGLTAVGCMVRLEQLELCIKKLRQRQREQRSSQAQRQQHAETAGKKGKKGKRATQGAAAEQQQTAAAAAADDIEEDLAVGASDDLELELLRERAERSLATLQQPCPAAAEAAGLSASGSLVSAYGPLVLSVLRQPAVYASSRLQSAAVVCLCQLMFCCPGFCSAQLPLLLTVWRQSSLSSVRRNAIVAIADLASRHPNLVEPWAEQLYAGLTDGEEEAALRCLLVLSHLLLNDAIKLKQAVVAVARCLAADDRPRLQQAARLFFSQLAAKSRSPVYNLLPQLISSLSQPASGLSQQQTRAVLSFLLSFVSKDRQTESIVARLCQRLASGAAAAGKDDWAAGDEAQAAAGVGAEVASALGPAAADPAFASWLQRARDVLYCLSCLSFSLPSLRRLLACFPLYEAALRDEEAAQQLQAVVSKCRKFAKPDMKAALDELEERMTRSRQRGPHEADGAAPVTARQPSQRRPRASAAAKEAREERGKEAALEAVDDSEDEAEQQQENRPSVTRGSAAAAAPERRARSAARGRAQAKSREGGGSRRPAKASRARGRSSRKKVSSDEDEEEEEARAAEDEESTRTRTGCSSSRRRQRRPARRPLPLPVLWRPLTGPLVTRLRRDGGGCRGWRSGTARRTTVRRRTAEAEKLTGCISLCCFSFVSHCCPRQFRIWGELRAKEKCLSVELLSVTEALPVSLCLSAASLTGVTQQSRDEARPAALGSVSV